ncbi:hypothetical protein [Deinococcus sonorensis]|uniref:Uncharacterized protein n=2 Tax=Deinococcus sonorensis TaxID=309891 RepID=A0AAU7U8G4_9DEIO
MDLLVVVDAVQIPEAERWRGVEPVEAEGHVLALDRWLTLGHHVHWQNFGLSQGRALLDPQGFNQAGRKVLEPPRRRTGRVEALDRYLNSTHRSVKAWRKVRRWAPACTLESLSRRGLTGAFVWRAGGHRIGIDSTGNGRPSPPWA